MSAPRFWTELWRWVRNYTIWFGVLAVIGLVMNHYDEKKARQQRVEQLRHEEAQREQEWNQANLAAKILEARQAEEQRLQHERDAENRYQQQLAEERLRHDDLLAELQQQQLKAEEQHRELMNLPRELEEERQRKAESARLWREYEENTVLNKLKRAREQREREAAAEWAELSPEEQSRRRRCRIENLPGCP
jgi:hypothetical protein